MVNKHHPQGLAVPGHPREPAKGWLGVTSFSLDSSKPGEENHEGLTAAKRESAVCLEEGVKAISAYFVVYYYYYW